MNPGKLLKQFGSIISGTLSGAIAAVGTSVNIPILGGAILSGALPAVAAIALGCMAAYGVHSILQQIDIVQIIPVAFEVEVIA